VELLFGADQERLAFHPGLIRRCLIVVEEAGGNTNDLLGVRLGL